VLRDRNPLIFWKFQVMQWRRASSASACCERLQRCFDRNIADLDVGEAARADPRGIREALLLCTARHAGDPLRAIAASGHSGSTGSQREPRQARMMDQQPENARHWAAQFFSI
jgi:hypothetical protein